MMHFDDDDRNTTGGDTFSRGDFDPVVFYGEMKRRAEGEGVDVITYITRRLEELEYLMDRASQRVEHSEQLAAAGASLATTRAHRMEVTKQEFENSSAAK